MVDEESIAGSHGCHLINAHPGAPSRGQSVTAAHRDKTRHRGPLAFSAPSRISKTSRAWPFGPEQTIGLVVQYARAAGTRRTSQIALVRDDGEVLVGSEDVVDSNAGAAVLPGHLLA